MTAALTILWVPVALAAPVRKSKDLHPGSGYGALGVESIGNFILWVMWLVGGAIATVCLLLIARPHERIAHRIFYCKNKWPTREIAGHEEDGHILITIVAFSWICFGVLTFIKFLVGMQYAALKGGAEAAHGPIQEKRPGTA